MSTGSAVFTGVDESEALVRTSETRRVFEDVDETQCVSFVHKSRALVHAVIPSLLTRFARSLRKGLSALFQLNTRHTFCAALVAFDQLRGKSWRANLRFAAVTELRSVSTPKAQELPDGQLLLPLAQVRSLAVSYLTMIP